MEFFNHIHCKYTGIRGFVTPYNDYLKYQYMIQDKAKKRLRLSTFLENMVLNPLSQPLK